MLLIGLQLEFTILGRPRKQIQKIAASVLQCQKGHNFSNLKAAMTETAIKSPMYKQAGNGIQIKKSDSISEMFYCNANSL